MFTPFDQRLNAIRHSPIKIRLGEIQRGIEKECLRIQPDGLLAKTAHPSALGSALTHSRITTDYSEALLEFITGVHTSIEACLDELDQIHRFVYQQLENEILWACSMPCLLKGDDNIPVAQYGSSNLARMKKIYRLGLGHRYGRLMQTIAGIHYNFSLPDSFWHHYKNELTTGSKKTQQSLQDFKTDQYFALIRNFRRFNWLLVYLFGSSPAICESFLGGRQHQLQEILDGTFGLPEGTSLRMGNLGYQSSAQDDLIVSYNGLQQYADSLLGALTEPHPDYSNIGLKKDGKYQQLSTALLQIENEFYGSIRPKRVTPSGITPLNALCDQGVEYIEVRCLDVNPFLPLGIDAEQIRFLDLFLLYCLLTDSPTFDDSQHLLCRENLRAVVNEGRKPELKLKKDDDRILLQDWGGQILTDIEKLASLLDELEGQDHYTASVYAQRKKIDNSALTPSAKIVSHLQDNQQAYFWFALQQSQNAAKMFKRRPLSDNQLATYFDLAKQSHQHQQDIESADTLSFDQHLHHYFQQYGKLKTSEPVC